MIKIHLLYTQQHQFHKQTKESLGQVYAMSASMQSHFELSYYTVSNNWSTCSTGLSLQTVNKDDLDLCNNRWVEM